jgi:hypothetical protein
MKTDRVLTMDEYLNERGMVPTRVEPAGCDTRHIPIAEDKDVDFQRNARSCNCDRWGHPCPGHVNGNAATKAARPFLLPLDE